MQNALIEHRQEDAGARTSAEKPQARTEYHFAPYYPVPYDFWGALSLPLVVPPETKPKVAQEIAPATEAAPQAAQTAAPQAEGKGKEPSFFLGHNGLGLKATAATALWGAGYLYSMASPAAFVAGAIVWWGIERAAAPFFEAKSSNPLNVGYYVIDKVSGWLMRTGKSLLSQDTGHGSEPTALATLAFGADALGLRSAVAAVSYCVGWSGAFGVASPALCGLAGAIMFRGAKQAFRAWHQGDEKPSKR